MFGLGPWELAIIFLIVLLVFGPKSLPKIGQAVGKGIKEFKDAAQGITSALEEDEKSQKTAQTQQVPPVTPTAQTETTSENTASKEHVS